jgi:hypothetical protein
MIQCGAQFTAVPSLQWCQIYRGAQFSVVPNLQDTQSIYFRIVDSFAN